MKYLIVLLMLFLSSCYTPTSYRMYLKQINYNGETDIATKLKIHGYFYSVESSSSNYPYTIIFWNDGTFLMNVNLNDLNKMDSLFCDLMRETDRDLISVYNKYRSWGYYKIKEDTVKGLVIHPFGGMSLYLYHVDFKIVNDTTLKRINECRVQSSVSKEDYNKSIQMFEEDNRRTLNFSYTECIPTFNPWLKEKRWFWADKESYKLYMKKLRAERRSKNSNQD